MKLKGELERMIAECSRGRVAECRVIEVLSTSATAAEASGAATNFPGVT
jgi:hypothetical protein